MASTCAFIIGKQSATVKKTTEAQEGQESGAGDREGPVEAGPARGAASRWLAPGALQASGPRLLGGIGQSSQHRSRSQLADCDHVSLVGGGDRQRRCIPGAREGLHHPFLCAS